MKRTIERTLRRLMAKSKGKKWILNKRLTADFFWFMSGIAARIGALTIALELINTAIGLYKNYKFIISKSKYNDRFNRKKDAYRDMLLAGEELERDNRSQEAIRCYKNALLYANDKEINSLWWRISKLYMRQGYTKRFWRVVDSLGGVAFSSVSYAEYYEYLKLINTIVLRLDNRDEETLLSVIRHLKKDGRYRMYKLVVVTDTNATSTDDFLGKLEERGIGTVVKDDDAYAAYLAAARLIVSDVDLGDFYIRKPSQTFIRLINHEPREYLKRLRSDTSMAGEVRSCMQSSMVVFKDGAMHHFERTGTVLAVAETRVLVASTLTDQSIYNLVTGNLEDFKDIPPSNKPKVLFYGSYGENGITSSFLNLMRKMDRSSFDIAVAADGNEMTRHPERHAVFMSLPKDVALLPMTGKMVATNKERRAVDYVETDFSYENADNEALYDTVYRREARRLYGETEFFAAINYEGYRLYWASLLPRVTARRSVIYTHNDMQREYENKYNKLQAVFLQYKTFSSVVGVSKSNAAINQRSLVASYQIPSDTFVYSDNIQDHTDVILRAREELPRDIERQINEAEVMFVAVGRLSPEKDHEKLIRAFTRVASSHRGVQMFICGEGAERPRLEELVESLGVRERVHLLGFVENPYPILKRADCFILSSNYEGQPVVLYEAMALEKPIVCTDIESTRDVIESGYGELVENSIDGLAEGMERYLRGEVKAALFDFDAYENRSLDRFYDVVLGIKRHKRGGKNILEMTERIGN